MTISVHAQQLQQRVAATSAALKPGIAVTAGELCAFVKAQVAAYKYPRWVWFVGALPKGPSGKILNREIVVPDEEAGP
jgi:long-chain acyl-CoA synthetase